MISHVTPALRPWSAWWPLATAFITGAVVMALEILGSRLLAPVFGNSLFVWGALIGVILAAMSSGYATGGWLADRHPSGTVIAWLLLVSALWTFLLAGAGQPVMFKVSSWVQDPRWGPCVAASVLLALPAFCLSGVLPALLRLSIDDLGHVGRHTGRMIAISTIGSLVGTWGTAFFLLTWMGSLALITLLAIMQLILGMSWWWRAVVVKSHMMTKVAGSALLVLCGAGLGWFAFHPALVLSAPLYQKDSPYQQVRVREDDLFRYLILDRTFHAVMWKADPIELYLPYSQLMMAALALHPSPKRALILGHGGGSLAKWLAVHWPDLEIDTVEVDPSVVQAAERYFEYQPIGTHHVHVADARMFLRTTDTRYDIIWLDVFARHLIPFHLTTQEFFQEVHAHLSNDGVLAVNLASSGEGPDRQRASAVVGTLRMVFPLIESFGVKGPWRTTNQPEAENLIFFAGSSVVGIRTPAFLERISDFIAQHRLPARVPELLLSRRTSEWPYGLVLTDDYAPYDLLIGREKADHNPS
ncbi:MAG TPA: fused MFS/spermidine synthase [Nitrospiraceae bacterium]|nr:fused MFS/spermidine synthase [Nitrospiraceae bacterium]